LLVGTPHTIQVRLAIFDYCNSDNLSVILSNSAAITKGKTNRSQADVI